MSTLILGDSIAVGISWVIKGVVIAKVGMSSCWIAAHVPLQHFDTAIISSGVNDRPGRCNAQVRAKVNADHVVWLNPLGWGVFIPARKGDRIISFRGNPHPRSYANLARGLPND